MDKSVCRICLAQGIRMHSIINTELQIVYEKLTGLSLDRTSCTTACYICCKLLQNCHRLMLQSLRADAALTLLLEGKQDPTPIELSARLCVVPVVSLDIIHETQHTDVPTDTLLKTEPAHLEQYVDVQEPTNISDSDDDVPLTEFKTEPKRKRQKYAVKRDRKHKNEKSNAVDWRSFSLSVEQQLDSVVSRSKSLNYINSPFKCELCYKGFIHQHAFDNHTITHHQSSGKYACPICQMRYTTEARRRRHIQDAHSRRYQCTKCDHVSITKHQAIIHSQWHSGRTYSCKLCGETFKKPTTYLSHVRSRHAGRAVCVWCGVALGAPRGLLLHTARAHRGMTEDEIVASPEAYCNDCDLQFANVDAYTRHVITYDYHTQTPQSECALCGWRSVGDVTVAAHMTQHRNLLKSGIKPAATAHLHVNCQQCNKSFSNKSKLQAHVNSVHLGLKYNKNIVCERCGKKCTSNATLRYHQRTHTGEKPYKCETCSKQFADSNRLKIHTRVHTGDRPYVCTLCGKTFPQKPALNRHARVHTGAKPYSCQYCGRAFSQSNSLKGHVNTTHLKIPSKRRNKQAPQTDNDK